MRRYIIPSPCTEYCVAYIHIIHIYIPIHTLCPHRLTCACNTTYIIYIHMYGHYALNVKIVFAPTWFPRESARNPFESRK